jgi:hypothetical protein
MAATIVIGHIARNSTVPIADLYAANNSSGGFARQFR